MYTFRIRSGYGFSPPSHEHVTAESFRHALERYLSPAARNFDPLRAARQTSSAPKAYAAGEAPRVSGISAHGDTLVIRLDTPAGDLPARLALPPSARYRPTCRPSRTASRIRSPPRALLPGRSLERRPRPQAEPELPRATTAAARRDRLQGRRRAGRGGAAIARGRFDYVDLAGCRPVAWHGGGTLRRPALSPDREQLDGAARAQHGETGVLRRDGPPRRRVRARPSRARARARRRRVPAPDERLATAQPPRLTPAVLSASARSAPRSPPDAR